MLLSSAGTRVVTGRNIATCATVLVILLIYNLYVDADRAPFILMWVCAGMHVFISLRTEASKLSVNVQCENIEHRSVIIEFKQLRHAV